MRKLICLLALLGAAAHAETTIGAHLGSVHAEPGFNNVNPGLYLKHEGYTVGTYYNSERRQSYYAGYTFEGEVYGPVSYGITVGAITGYRQANVMPLVGPSLKLALPDGWGARAFFIPKTNKGGSAVISFTIERSF